MPETSKIFTYELDGLTYTVTVYEDGGAVFAEISVSEGAMDVNALYYGDDDFSGDSESLSGPLNMNGVRLDGDKVQWDEAAELSDPGLGPEGEDKETYLSEGDSLTVQLDATSIDEIDVFGIRATSTTTPEGSIKAVSDDPEEPEEPEFLFEKVGFGYETFDNGVISDGAYINDEDLPDDVDATFAGYVSYFENDLGGDIPSLEVVAFFETDENGNPSEIFRIDAPEGGFETSEDLIAAYDAAVDGGALDGVSAEENLFTMLATLEPEETDETVDDGADDTDGVEPELV